MTFAVPIVVSVIAAAASIYGIYAGRDKATASTYKEMAATIAELNDEVRELRSELRELYSAMDTMRGAMDILRSRVSELEAEAHGLRDRLRVLEQYTRRLINQLRKAGMTPDIPTDVIEHLFKGEK